MPLDQLPPSLVAVAVEAAGEAYTCKVRFVFMGNGLPCKTIIYSTCDDTVLNNM